MAISKNYRTFKIAGVSKKFYPSNCGTNRAMKSLAATLRGRGVFARVVKSGNKSCVYTNKPQRTKSYTS